MLQFESKELQVTEAEVDGKVQRVVSLADVANVLGYDRKGLYEIVKGHPLVRDQSCVVLNTTQGQKRQQVVLTYEGLVGVLCRIHPDRIPDSDKRERILRFQRWAISTLAKVLRGEVVAGSHPDDLAAQVADLKSQIQRMEVVMAEPPYPALPDPDVRPVSGRKSWTFHGIRNILAVMRLWPSFTVYDVMVECGLKHKLAVAHMQAATLHELVSVRVIKRSEFPAGIANFTESNRCYVYQLTDWGKEQAQKAPILVQRR